MICRDPADRAGHPLLCLPARRAAGYLPVLARPGLSKRQRVGRGVPRVDQAGIPGGEVSMKDKESGKAPGRQRPEPRRRWCPGGRRIATVPVRPPLTHEDRTGRACYVCHAAHARLGDTKRGSRLRLASARASLSRGRLGQWRRGGIHCRQGMSWGRGAVTSPTDETGTLLKS